MTAKIVTIANHKGGCSKTTTAKAIAEILYRDYKKRILCVDTDPQANFTSWSGVNANDCSLYELLSPNKQNYKIEDVLKITDDYDLIPSDMRLAGVVNELTSQVGSERQLKTKLDEAKEMYDFIIIDTPPSLNLLAINDFVTSDEIILSTDSNMFATTGIYRFFETIQTIKKYYNPTLQVAGVLLTKFDNRFVTNKVVAEVTEKLTKELNINLFKTRIRASVDMSLATTYSMSLLDLKPEPKPVSDYKTFVKEFLNEEK